MNRDDADPGRASDDTLLAGLRELPEGALDLPRAPMTLRKSVAEGAARALARRRRARTATRLALLAVFYLAGVGSGVWLTRPAVAPPSRGDDHREQRQPHKIPTPDAPSGAGLEELASRAAAAEAASLWTAAGDRHLQGAGGVPAALRCYQERVALDAAAAPEDRTPPASDSWLLLALSNARDMKETPR